MRFYHLFYNLIGLVHFHQFSALNGGDGGEWRGSKTATCGARTQSVSSNQMKIYIIPKCNS